MFFNGDLHSGIATAVRESKPVVCFVRDGGDLSSKWERDYLLDATIQEVLSQRSIALRIEAGSQEAGFLSAYYPINSVPVFLVIR